MKFRAFPFLLLLCLWSATPALAGDDACHGGRRGPGWGDGQEMVPDERREMRRQMREHWRQEHAPNTGGERRWRDMDPDERRRLREEMREHRQELRRERRARPDEAPAERMPQADPPM